jgi:hypothetical protein
VNSFIIGIFAGAIGMGYFIYGKRQAKFAPMIAGCCYAFIRTSPRACFGFA